MARVHIVVIKYTFYAAMVFTAGFVIERLTGIKHSWKVDPIVADDLVYNASSPLQSRNYEKVLTKRYLKCLTEPSKPFCLLSANKRLEVFRSKGKDQPSVEEIESRLHNITSGFPSSRRRLHTLLAEFTKVMKAYDVNVVLIEPSMLFCLLSSTAKFGMLAKGFNPGRMLGSRNVINVGILDRDSEKLEVKNLTNDMLSAGFKIIKFRKWLGNESQKEFETAHYFFVMEDVAVHAVVFYARNNYLWHAGLDPKDIDFEGLLFVNEEMYENFTLLPLNLAGTSISTLFLPHDIRRFMGEIEFSKIIECKTDDSVITKSVEHPTLTREQLVTRVVIVLKELKAIFAPRIAFFLLWSESLLGWFNECDIFHFSSSLDLALLFKNIQQLNLTEILADNEFLRPGNVTETRLKYEYKLDCHGLQVNMYFIHEDSGFVWHKYSEDEDHVYKYKPRGGSTDNNLMELTAEIQELVKTHSHIKTQSVCQVISLWKTPENPILVVDPYSSFTLCSSELYGQKIQVPCNITDVLEMEFGRNGTWNFLPTT